MREVPKASMGHGHVGLEARIVELAGTVRALLAGLARVEREVAALGVGLVAAEVQVKALERARGVMVGLLRQHVARADALQAQVDALAAAGAVVERAVREVRARGDNAEALRRAFDGEDADE